MTIKELCSMIDHTNLKPDATAGEIEVLCAEAREYGFASVCVNPYRVEQAKALLDGSEVKVCTVIGFPLGAGCRATKANEADLAVSDGAKELDMVINIGALKSGDIKTVYKDIAMVVGVGVDRDAIVKVIIETCLLTEDEKIAACQAAVRAGAAFVKTSTGFSKGGATIEDVKLMKGTVGESCLVKASGGIRTLETALAMIEAGASRLGTSNGVAIVEELLALKSHK